MVASYPLHWPDGWLRTPPEARQERRYRPGRAYSDRRSFWTFAEARVTLMEELDLLGARNVVISSNYELRRDGRPRAGGRTPEDGGVAVYFNLEGRPTVLACDRHGWAAENLRAIAMAVKALSLVERHGGGVIFERSMRGFATRAGNGEWWSVLRVAETATREEIESAFRELARAHHPDRGGSQEKMAELNGARERALRDRG
jgi:hypothetical protein